MSIFINRLNQDTEIIEMYINIKEPIIIEKYKTPVPVFHYFFTLISIDAEFAYSLRKSSSSERLMGPSSV